MALQYAYQGKQISRNKNQANYKETLYGSLTQIDTYIAGLQIGTRDATKGYLRSWTKTQKQANIWQVEVEYSISYDFDFTDEAETVTGKKSAQLSVRNIQMPLESHPNYRTIWNHYLISNNGMAPTWVFDKTDILLSADEAKNYRWIKSLGELPLPDGTSDQIWQVAADMQKKGVEYYDMALFVVTISAKYNSASAAGNSIGKNINKITSPSQDFGLGGQWKYDQASVSYDGKSWIATSVYTRAADQWDPQIYD